MIRANKSKYGNKRVEWHGISFDSKKEMQRYLALKDAQNKGIISELELQPTFELIPKITEKYIKRLKTKDKECERTVQLPCTYTADFRYNKDGVMVVEDVKISPKMLPPEYVLREKMFRYKFGFPIKRVYKPTDEI